MLNSKELRSKQSGREGPERRSKWWQCHQRHCQPARLRISVQNTSSSDAEMLDGRLGTNVVDKGSSEVD